MAKLENLQKDKSKTNTKIIWPVLFKRFIDDGFGSTEANKEEFEYWVQEFNLLSETITIDKFKFENKVDSTNNLILSELGRYVRCNTIKRNFMIKIF